MKNFLVTLLMTCSTAVFCQTEVTFYTTKGDFTVTLNDSLMPITTGNFIGLVNSKGYDGKTFYRVISNFVIQGGYRTNTPPPIPDEFDSTGTLSNRRWTLAMANAGPNTGSSEIFINLKDNLFLDYDKPPLTSAHPVFGAVSSGWTTVADIGLVAVDGNDEPVIPVVMDSLRVTSSPLSNSVYTTSSFKATIYPNPITSASLLEIHSGSQQPVNLELFDPTGKLISSSVRSLSPGQNVLPLGESDLLPDIGGIYFLRIELNQEFVVIKIRARPH